MLVEIYHDGQFLISAQVPFDNDSKPPIHIPLKKGNGEYIKSTYFSRRGGSTYSEYLSLGCTARIYPNGVFDDNASTSYCISACIQKWEENRWQFVQTLDVVDNYIDLRNLNIGYDHALRLVLDGSMTCQGLPIQRWFDRYRIGYSFQQVRNPNPARQRRLPDALRQRQSRKHAPAFRRGSDGGRFRVHSAENAPLIPRTIRSS